MLISFFINIIQISLAVLHPSLLAAFISNVTANFIFANRLRLVHCISESEHYYRMTLKLKNILYNSTNTLLNSLLLPTHSLSHSTPQNAIRSSMRYFSASLEKTSPFKNLAISIVKISHYTIHWK